MLNLLALCCLTSPRELVVIAVCAVAILGLPLWTWYRKVKLAEEDRDKPPRT